MPPMLQLDLQQIASQSLSFLLLIWVMRRFAWRPILGALDARRARIEQGFREIADGKAQDTIEREVAKAKVTLRNEIADMTVDAVERLLRQRCDDAADRKLIASIIDELGEAPVRG